MSCKNISLIFVQILFFNLCLGNETMDLFSSSDRSALNKFRDRLGDLEPTLENTDDYLIRWPKAKGMNIEAAAQMFEENAKWRIRNKIDGILNETILEFNPPPVLIEGFDKEGYPLMFVAPTHIDARKLVLQGLREKIIRYWYQNLEKCAQVGANAPKLPNGHNVTKVTGVLDLQGYNLRQHFCLECIAIYRQFFIAIENYYPESMRHFVILNVPRVAHTIIEIIRPLLSPNSMEALIIFGTNKKEYSTYLLKYVDADELPYRYGGTKKTAMRLG